MLDFSHLPVDHLESDFEFETETDEQSYWQFLKLERLLVGLLSDNALVGIVTLVERCILHLHQALRPRLLELC